MKDISLHILDIVQNSVSAGSSLIMIEVDEKSEDDRLLLTISDNGRGMDRDVLQKVSDPYFTTRTTRKVGLGIPFLKQSAEQSAGNLMIRSDPGRGTVLQAAFGLSHMDRPPKGDIAGVVSILAGANPSVDFVYRHSVSGKSYLFDTREVREVLENVPVSEPSVIRFIKEMIDENLRDIEPQLDKL